MSAFNFNNLSINSDIALTVNIDKNGTLTLSKNDGVVSKRIIKTSKVKVYGRVTLCINRGDIKAIVSTLKVGVTKKIKTFYTDSALRKCGYNNGMILSIKKVGPNTFNVTRVS